MSTVHSLRSHTPSGVRVLALTTLQQAGLTVVRFGLPILAPFWRDALHLSLGQVGMLLAAFDFGSLLLFIPIGLLADRWGEPAVLTAGALFTAAMTMLITRAQTFGSLAGLLVIAGLGYGSGQTAGTKAVSAAFGAGGRGTAMGVRQSGLPLGGLIAAVFLPPLAGAFGWQTAIAGAAAVCAVPGILCWLGLRDTREPAPVSGTPSAPSAAAAGPGLPISTQLREILRASGVMRTAWTATLLVIVQFCYQGYLALYLVDRFRWSKHAAAAVLIAVHLGGVTGRLAWGALSDAAYHGRRVPALAWCVGAGLLFPIVLVVLPSASKGPAVSLAAFAGGILLLGWNGLYSTLITELAGPRLGATAMGVSMTMLYAATMFTLPAFGWLVDHTAYTVGWTSLVGVMALALAATFRIPEPTGAAVILAKGETTGGSGA